ncbi:MAG: hypothetical protein M3308_05165 [Actinomycetota bacterium]|nr:hypothetical protein [Actinomycetota bacterium]
MPGGRCRVMPQVTAVDDRLGTHKGDAGFVVGIARPTLLTTSARDGDPAAMLQRVRPVIDHCHGVGAWTQLWITIRALIETLSRAGRHREVALLLGAQRASARATPEFGTDSARVRAAEDRARAALGPDFNMLIAKGAALDDSDAVA